MLRRDILSAVGAARRGHVASAYSLVEILRALYDDILHVRPLHPTWANRDRFILSKGHGCLALYALLADKGFFPKQELTKFCSFDGILGGHPQYGKVRGVEASTGSLGHGFSIAVGIALMAKRQKKSYKTVVVISDGECDEGSTWEAALAAAKHKLDNLLVLVDYNKMQSYGSTFDVLDLEPLAEKWKSFGFDVREVNGHDPRSIKNACIAIYKANRKPHMVICHTVKGKGSIRMEGDPAWHHKTKITDAELSELYKDLQ
jgi:transketolase